MDSSVKPRLRSIHNHERTDVKFMNTTKYNVKVYWVNFEGGLTLYGTLSPFSSMDMHTFVSHPWIFVEEETGDRFIAEGKNVHMPKSLTDRYIGIPNHVIPQSIFGYPLFITVPLYSLRDMCLRVIKRLLRDDAHAFKLDIPLSLQVELASMLPRKSIQAKPRRQV